MMRTKYKLKKIDLICDRKLVEVSESFDFLLQITPINFEQARSDFIANRYSEPPKFKYRRLNIEPDKLRRRLNSIPLVAIEFSPLIKIFKAKQDELDRQLSFLADVDNKRGYFKNLLIYKKPELELVNQAKKILRKIPARERDAGPQIKLGSARIVKLAKRELAYYRIINAEFKPKVQIRSDIISPLMVIRDVLLVAKTAQIPKSRINAILQHEIGTHLLTRFNGSRQPLSIFEVGLTGYDELQEGLAILAEYLVGGLTRSRLRLLAGRVVASSALVHGADFIETFRLLTKQYGFTREAAFPIVFRIFRGGGITKDSSYLGGLLKVINLLQHNYALEPLYAGKISLRFLDQTKLLVEHNIMSASTIIPRFLTEQSVQQRIQRVRNSSSVFDLIKRAKI